MKYAKTCRCKSKYTWKSHKSLENFISLTVFTLFVMAVQMREQDSDWPAATLSAEKLNVILLLSKLIRWCLFAQLEQLNKPCLNLCLLLKLQKVKKYRNTNSLIQSNINKIWSIKEINYINSVNWSTLIIQITQYKHYMIDIP